MASLRIEFRAEELNRRLRATLMQPDGIVRRDAQRRARAVRDRARVLARARSRDSTGALPRSIRFTTVTLFDDNAVISQVGSDLDHAIWTEQGTGVFGPHGTPIVPRTAKFLKFRSRTIVSTRLPPRRRFNLNNPQQGRLFLLRSVKGQPGKHYLRDSLSAAGD